MSGLRVNSFDEYSLTSHTRQVRLSFVFCSSVTSVLSRECGAIDSRCCLFIKTSEECKCGRALGRAGILWATGSNSILQIVR